MTHEHFLEAVERTALLLRDRLAEQPAQFSPCIIGIVFRRADALWNHDSRTLHALCARLPRLRAHVTAGDIEVRRASAEPCVHPREPVLRRWSAAQGSCCSTPTLDG